MAEPIGNGVDQTSAAQLLNAEAVAGLLGFSVKQIYRMEAEGYIPRGIRLTGGSLRWPRKAIEKWVEEGCPSCRQKK